MFKPNKLVKVKSFEQIIQTLDKNGCVDGLPFMPEMVEYCDKTFRISLKVEKTCVDNPTMFMAEFRNNDVYFLEDLRCSGVYHDGCQRACRIFWKECWLEPIEDINEKETYGSEKNNFEELKKQLRTKQSDEIYFCQSTQLRDATIPLTMKEKILKLFIDVKIGTYNFYEALILLVYPLVRKLIRRIKDQHPKGELTKTPEEILNLKPGELVQVRAFDEIVKTLDKRGRNKGLIFEPEMKVFCGKQFKVRNRLEKMILERSGRMVEVKNSVILEGVTCECYFAFGGCPRKEFQYWREIWLKRIN
ncbi:Hypothetical protein IALB_2483 [Ignavibacterium album JCM 16511]|uniref:Uncharacterized protein n=1 Tax=Ignavibacterium album (strain DSM 19864 / JCM 16511 / NBRC 101810 / Mat9-16) TaxID=945713 RepID=I0AMH9_IGNAJ|nr:hypothetical protein [Ignavibacterium album]AFH50186.1 Hypothetical protein IALB_2483 [Ignavibacterium album JCM 16511]